MPISETLCYNINLTHTCPGLEFISPNRRILSFVLVEVQHPQGVPLIISDKM